MPADANGRVDPDEADRILAATREPTLPKEPAPPSAPARPSPTPRPAAGFGNQTPTDLPTLLLRARTKTEVEKGKLLALKAKVEAGRFVDADEVKVAAFNRARIVRDALLNLASRLSPLVAAESDERACFDLIDREVRQALDELAGPA